MKRVVSFLLITLMLLTQVPVITTAALDTAQSNGFTNVPFSNGYVGFCIDMNLDGAYTGDSFGTSNTSVAINNSTKVDVSQKLKILFTQCFADIFTADGNGSYVINSTNSNTVQSVVWYYTDNRYIWGVQKTLANKIDAYAGDPIPDDGYSITLDNGDVVTFSFLTMTTNKADQQDFFAYKLTVSNEPPHQHDYGDEWVTDGENHWHECECGDKSDEGTHEGGTADCDSPAECEICGEPYGDTDPDNHTGDTYIKDAKEPTVDETGYTGDTHCSDCDALLEKGEEIPKLHKHDYSDEWVTDGDNHWHECECGDKSDEGTHEGGTADCDSPAECEICGEPYGDTDPDNHTGDTYIKDAKEPTVDETGYTG
ncbi:MAG: hypothetical protein IKK83_01670, partial [Clostridia bacterium]|nr:hypothetical protein [Clostridia bacterium]